MPNLERFYELCAFMKLNPRDYMIDLSFAKDDLGAFDKVAFRASLSDTRREHNLTQKQAAEKAGIPISVYERIEKSGIANIHNYIHICTTFALDPDDYLLR
jgi:DNA-binding XRE family transcriptional regulator